MDKRNCSSNLTSGSNRYFLLFKKILKSPFKKKLTSHLTLSQNNDDLEFLISACTRQSWLHPTKTSSLKSYYTLITISMLKSCGMNSFLLEILMLTESCNLIAQDEIWQHTTKSGTPRSFFMLMVLTTHKKIRSSFIPSRNDIDDQRVHQSDWTQKIQN